MFGRGKSSPTVDDQTKLDLQLVSSLQNKKIPSWQQIRQLTKILDSQERRRILIVITLIILSGAGLLLRFYQRHTVVTPKFGGSYTEGLIGTPRYINPLLATGNDVDRDLSQLIFSGLMKVDNEGQLVPDLADNYTVSEDHKTYTFQLKDSVQWHDGEPLTAEDVVYTINTLQDPEFKSPLRLSFSGVRVDALDDTKVRFQLSQPFAPFLNSLTVGIIPKHVWYSIPASSATLAEPMTKPIGSGPYKFKSLTKDSKSGAIRLYTLEANKNYFNQPPYIAELSFKFYPDFNSGVEALKNQNVEGLSLLPKENQIQASVSKKVNILNLIVPQYTAVFFNPDANADLKNVKLRQALAYGLDREKVLAQAINKQGNIINSPILPGMPGYDTTLKGYDYNTGQANSLLETSGWTRKEGEQYRSDKDKKVLELTLTTVDQPETVAVTNLIKTNWEALGIKTNVNIVGRNRIRKDVIEPRSYQLLLFGQILGLEQDPYPFWHSSQTKNPGLNLSNLANRDIDSALEKARASDSITTKKEQYTIFQNIIRDQAFALFLYNPSYSYPISKKIKGVDQLTRINIPAERFTDITHWYIKTSRTWSK